MMTDKLICLVNGHESLLGWHSADSKRYVAMHRPYCDRCGTYTYLCLYCKKRVCLICTPARVVEYPCPEQSS